MSPNPNEGGTNVRPSTSGDLSIQARCRSESIIVSVEILGDGLVTMTMDALGGIGLFYRIPIIAVVGLLTLTQLSQPHITLLVTLLVTTC